MAKVARTGLRFIDRFILFTAWLVTCGLVYGLGFYTGKGTQERRLGMEERIVRLPVTAAVPPEGQRPKASNEFTFYETLVAGDRARETTGGRATVPEAMPPTTIVPPSRLGTAPAPPAGTAPSDAAPTPAHAGTQPAKPSGTVAAAPKPAVAGAPKPVVTDLGSGPKPPPSFSAAVAPAPKPVPAVPVAVPPPAAPAPPRKAGWTVEASPSRDRAEVESLLAGLRSRGYDARVVSVRRDGDTWYRLRVGRYATSAEASEVMRRLREREGVSHAFVASE